MQVTDLIFKAKDYVYFAIFSNEESKSAHWLEPILPILTSDKKILIAGDIKENERYRHLLSRLTVKEFDTFTDVVVINVDHTYEEAKKLLTDD